MDLRCPTCFSNKLTLHNRIYFVQFEKLSIPLYICSSCSHRFLMVTNGQQAKIDGIYNKNYAGHRIDDFATNNMKKIFDKIVEDYNITSGRILDVGCGSGEFINIFKDSSFTAKGIDISEDGIKACRQKGLDAVVGNYLSYDFDSKFSVIAFWDVLEHLQNPTSFLDRALKLLENNGIVIFKVPYFQSFDFLLTKISSRFATILLGAPGHQQFYSESSILQMSKKAGFDHCTIKHLAGIRSKPKVQGIKRLKRGIIQIIKKLSGDGNYFVVLSSESNLTKT